LKSFRWGGNISQMTKTQIQLPEELFREVRAFSKNHEWSLAEAFQRGAELLLQVYPDTAAAAPSIARRRIYDTRTALALAPSALPSWPPPTQRASRYLELLASGIRSLFNTMPHHSLTFTH
jgi:hypothetical protein